MVKLLRHTAVAKQWQGRCYGVIDAGLSTEGIAAARALAKGMVGITRIQASPLRRAKFLGALLSRQLGLPLEIVPALCERDFGVWEGQSWDTIYAAEGDAMMGMIDAPASFRPGGGETTEELAQRVFRWYTHLSPESGCLAVTHGGPIAAIRGILAELPVRDWPGLVPAVGKAVCLPSQQPTH